ncbi:MAG: hypothetical protein WC565_09220 [Parcubacteria group bacterium]|nr:hypothetical protein [Methanoregula sp.]
MIDEPASLEEIYLVPIETHNGAEEFNEILFDSWMDWALDTPQARLLFPGDLLECATRSSIGDVFHQKLSPGEQIKDMIERLKPVSDKIYGLTAGNHEWRVTKESDIEPVELIATALGVPYFRDGQGILKVRVGSKENAKPAAYIIHFGHGGSNAGTNGGRLNAAEKMADVVENSDVVIYGHTHGKAASEQQRLIFDAYNNHVREDKRYVVLAGSMLGYAGYVKRKSKRPLPVGCPRIRLDGRKKDVHVTI